MRDCHHKSWEHCTSTAFKHGGGDFFCNTDESLGARHSLGAPCSPPCCLLTPDLDKELEEGVRAIGERQAGDEEVLQGQGVIEWDGRLQPPEEERQRGLLEAGAGDGLPDQEQAQVLPQRQVQLGVRLHVRVNQDAQGHLVRRHLMHHSSSKLHCANCAAAPSKLQCGHLGLGCA
jgi:hypothetical protein